jgi:cytochrome c-type biogenesis protein CcmF
VIPELGQFALILAFCLALTQAIMPLAGAALRRPEWMQLGAAAAAGQFVFILLAFAVLARAFLMDDFSVLYVARNSNSALPDYYKFAAVWGAHEGSMLFWCLVQSLWIIAVAVSSRRLERVFAARVLGVLGILSSATLAFTLFTSNPFDRLLPAAADGVDLNPLLQDPGLLMHPPALYPGYVGFSVAFAFAVAALMSGRIDLQWARWTRPWTVWPWIWLTAGITLGSWWSYYELGWGGWWAWDPVENASFMPWLLGTALIHSLAVTEKRGLFMGWTLLLAITTFSLSLLGTFLVRSGVLVSVHAFASDPARGLFILCLLGGISGSALLLYAVKAGKFFQAGGFKPWSREFFLLLNNALLMAATGVILFGTLYPLFLDALGAGKISVGPPYFETAFLIPMLPLVYLVGAGMHAAWREVNARSLVVRLTIPAVLALGGALIGVIALSGARPAESPPAVLAFAGIMAALWVIGASLVEPIRKLRKPASVQLTAGTWGMSIAHLGMGMFILGATVTSGFSIEDDLAAAPGERFQLGRYDIVFREMRDFVGPNYRAREALFDVEREGRRIVTLAPQHRVYRVRASPMTEAAIDAGLTRDLFIALGQELGRGRWSLRVQHKPLLSFLWLGALVMVLGGGIASLDRRYRAASVRAVQTVPHNNSAVARQM